MGQNVNYNKLNSNSIKRSSPTINVTWEGSLYDVTDFAARHPGGQEILEKYNGQDVETVMRDPAIHQHSKAAYSILKKYLVEAVSHHASRDKDLNQKENPSATGDKEISEDFDGYVDWSQPLIGQVEELGDRYYEWAHQQVDRPIRLFHSDLAEWMTRAYWWMVPLVWCPVILYMVRLSYGHLAAQSELWPKDNFLARHYGPGSMPLLFLMGILFWTFLEYVIHRWLFHLKPPGSSRFLIRLHFSLHGQHHKSPMDPMRLVFPPLPASVFAVFFYLLTGMVFPTGMSQIVFAGIVSGYVAYDLTHYYVHHGGTPSIEYFRRLKKYHTLHHYKHQQLGFGISSKLWDFPFNTLIPDDLKPQKVQ